MSDEEVTELDELGELESTLGVEFNEPHLLKRALTHRSYLNENPEGEQEDNERLEYLGDAVLDFVVGAYLFDRFPEMNEGELTALRASVVRTRTLAGFANQFDLGHYLRLGYGEAETGGRERKATLCAAFEAVVGAMYLDQGLDRVRQFVHPLVEPALEHIMAESLYKDARSEFQIWAQAQFNVTPRYEVVEAIGPDHDKLFTVAVMVGDEVWGRGQGRSKQSAAQAAAGAAMERAEEQ